MSGKCVVSYLCDHVQAVILYLIDYALLNGRLCPYTLLMARKICQALTNLTSGYHNVIVSQLQALMKRWSDKLVLISGLTSLSWPKL